jgi:hypothetical protein
MKENGIACLTVPDHADRMAEILQINGSQP